MNIRSDVLPQKNLGFGIGSGSQPKHKLKTLKNQIQNTKKLKRNCLP